jgi:pimeloyl-ACP methyl ester carboxylesterase
MAGIEQALTFKDPAGHAVSGILASPPHGSDRLAILCHGFLSNKNSHTNTTLTELLLPQDIATFRFDFFGQGESEGPFEEITVSLALSQALAALDLMHSKGYRKMALVGSSFGGLVSILAAAKWLSHPTVSPARPRPAGKGFCPEGRAHSRSLSCLALKCPVPDFPEMLQLELGETEMARWKATDTIPNVVPGGSGRIKLAYAFY